LFKTRLQFVVHFVAFFRQVGSGVHDESGAAESMALPLSVTPPSWLGEVASLASLDASCTPVSGRALPVAGSN
jgi:hypothetical protein